MAGYLVGLDINDVASETFSGNASTTAFTLAAAGTTNSTGVYILGVHQVPSTDYSVSGTTLTFTTAPPTGTNNISVVYTKPAIVNTPADGTITTAKLSGALVTPGTLDLNGQELILDADADTSITADTDDQIDIKIGGADDFQFTANKFLVQTGSNIDMNGTELILDADADTSITADTNDQIDFKLAGADDFRMTANNFNVLSGSTLTVDSGATIVNSGTATNFGTDSESAYAGVLQTNANFVDQVIFGPSVDGRAWNGLWNKASVFSSLMLATIEDEGSNTEINIWDLTEQTSGVISTTPLATVDLSAAATPTSIAACMGYLIVGSEDGTHIIDPHSGAWAERTQGWPRSLSTSTAPALHNNDVQGVAAGFSTMPRLDSRTGGGMPNFGVNYGTGTKNGSLIKEDGNVWDMTGDGNNVGTGVGIHVGRLFIGYDSAQFRVSPPIHTVVADQTVNPPYLFVYGDNATAYNIAASPDKFSAAGDLIALASGEGLGFNLGLESSGKISSTLADTHENGGLNASITRVFNTGYCLGTGKGLWLSNSKTVDRSPLANTLTENGTVTEGVVETSAELLGYSGFTNSTNYFSRASDADWDVLGTGTYYMSVWFKCTAVVSGAAQYLMAFNNSAASIRANIAIASDGTFLCSDTGATAGPTLVSTDTFIDSVWHKADYLRESSTSRALYIDGTFITSNTTDAGSISSSGNLPLAIGGFGGTGGASAQNCTLALAHLSATAPTATQIRQMYDAEKGMFVASAECLLQSGSTDAVLDVDVDPLTGKVLVTQTDAITIFDGLVVDSKPTVNSGASEKGKLWGDLRTEQNAANAYVTAPAVDQRQVNEMVRSLSSDLPAGVDLSKAKAWCTTNADSTIAASYNIKSVTDGGTGDYFYNFAVPFKSSGTTSGYVPMVCTGHPTAGMGGGTIAGINGGVSVANGGQHLGVRVYVTTHAGAARDDPVSLVVFGELENE